MPRSESFESQQLNEALDAYLGSVKKDHSETYWDRVNGKIADDHIESDKRNTQFRPSRELMLQVFSI